MLSKVSKIKNVVDSTVAFAIEYETLIAFTYDVKKTYLAQGLEKKVEEDKKRNEEENRLF